MTCSLKELDGLKKIISFLILACSLVCVIPAQAQADHNNHPDFIDWVYLERYFLAEYEYTWLENSPVVSFLQYLLQLPREAQDGVYGPVTRRNHTRRAITLGIQINAQYGGSVVFPDNVERWRDMVSLAIARYGGPPEEVDKFLRVMRCESQGLPDATNPSSNAAGLMQHLPQFWDARAATAGYPGFSPYDPEANINVSAWLLYQATGGGWQHWNFGCL